MAMGVPQHVGMHVRMGYERLHSCLVEAALMVLHDVCLKGTFWHSPHGDWPVVPSPPTHAGNSMRLAAVHHQALNHLLPRVFIPALPFLSTYSS